MANGCSLETKLKALRRRWRKMGQTGYFCYFFAGLGVMVAFVLVFILDLSERGPIYPSSFHLIPTRWADSNVRLLYLALFLSSITGVMACKYAKEEEAENYHSDLASFLQKELTSEERKEFDEDHLRCMFPMYNLKKWSLLRILPYFYWFAAASFLILLVIGSIGACIDLARPL